MNNLTKLQTQKVCTALLASLMATCSTSPSYADQENVLTTIANTGNNANATPHCVVRFGDLILNDAPPRQCGFFVRSIQLCPRYDGLDGDTFGCAGVVEASSPTPSSLSPSLATSVMDLQSNLNEVNHD